MIIFRFHCRPRNEEDGSVKPAVTIAPALAPPPKMTAYTASSAPAVGLDPFLVAEEIPEPEPTTCKLR
jgi:hypothetical protein